MTTIKNLSKNTGDISQVLTNQKTILEKTKKQIHGDTQKELTQEEFDNMSWENLQNNIRLIDNKVTLFGKTINYRLTNVFWSFDKREGLDGYLKQKTLLEKTGKQFKDKELLVNILQVWIPEAYKQSQMWFKSFRNDDELIVSNIEKINLSINNFGIPVNDEIFLKQINHIFYLMGKSEEQEDIIGTNDLEKIKNIFLNKNISFEKKEIQIFNLTRYGGYSGNSEGTKEIIANKLIETSEFTDVKEILNDSRIKEYLEDDNIYVLNKLIGKELTKDLIKTYKKVIKQIHIKYESILKEKNKENKKNNKPELKFNDFLQENKQEIEEQTLNSTFSVFKHILLKNKIEKLKYRGNQNESLVGIYANINGLGETSKGDFFTIGDDNIDLAIDFATTLAIGAVTMGAGMGAIGLAKWGISGARAINLGNKAAKTLKISKYLQEGSKTGKIAGFIGSSSLEGVSFYEGATIAQNLLFRDNINLDNWENAFIGTGDKHELIKNIVFMGSLNSLKFLSGVPGLGKIMSYEAKIPDIYLKPGYIKKVIEGAGNLGVSGLRDGTMMFGMSGIIDWAFGEGWHPSWREYLEFVTLIQLMHLKDIRLNNKVK